MPHRSQEELAQIIAEVTADVKVGDRFVHYKSPDLFYRIIDIALREADETPCVVYKAEYGEQISYVRPYDDWTATVQHDNQEVPRFTKVAEI
jgi:hypothetical protein